MVKMGPSVLVLEELGGLWGSGSLTLCLRELRRLKRGI